MVGKFVLERFNGQEIYNFERGTITTTRDGDKFRLWFSVMCEGKPIKVLPDTEELGACPYAELTVAIDDLKMLDEYEIYISEGYDKELEDYITSIYYCEHQDLDNNHLVIHCINEKVFKVLWTGTTMDVNYYDGSKPDTRVQIDGEFILKIKE